MRRPRLIPQTPIAHIAPVRIAIVIVLALSCCPTTALAQWVHNGTPVCTATGTQNDASMLADGAGGCFIAWDDARGGTPQIYAQHLDLNGNATWIANGINVCNQTGNETLPQIVTDGAGGCMIVWQDTRSGTSIIYGQRLNGSGSPQWNSAGVALTTGTASQTKVVAVSDGAGGVIAAWEDARDSNEVYCQRLGPSGSPLWSAAGVRALPASTTAADTGPRIDSDGSGGAVIAGAVAGATAKESRVHGQRISGAGAALWGADGVVAFGTNFFALSPTGAGVLSDGSGGAYLSWTANANITNNNFSNPTMLDLARRLDSSGACVPGWSADGGTLGGNPLLVSALQERQVPLGVPSAAMIFPDGAGGAIFVTACEDEWTFYQPRFSGTINVSHAAGNGVHDWTQACEITSWDNSSAGSWRAVGDGSGGVIVGWNSNEGLSSDGLYAIRMGKSGVAAGWGSAGVLVADASGTPVAQSICTDGAGGAIIAYTRGGDIYAAKVGSGGAVASVGPAPGLAGAGLTLESVSPNPTRSAVRVDFVLSQAGQARLSLFDVQGRKVLERDEGQLAAGAHELEFAPKAPLAAGVYEMRVTSGGASRSARFVVEH